MNEPVLSMRDWLMTGAVGIIVMAMLHELRELRLSVEKLNITIAVMAEKNANLDERLEKVEKRLDGYSPTV